ncbi:MAG: FecR domain-containing protein [Chitinophagaceae bacterium]|nr:FecR domain-containing protein [Chitinophagaceae bacterium]
MDKEQIIALAERFVKGIATEEEKALLHQWYDSWQDDEEFISVDTPQSPETIRERILLHLQQSMQQNASTPPVRSIKRNRYSIVAAAAVMLLLAAGTAYYTYVQRAEKPVADVPKAIQTDAAPGGNKAMLTLSDGATIMLDSAADGNLSQQGATEIVKTKDGQLVYNISAEANKYHAADVLYNKISTPRGGQYQLTLPDGTRVWLNAASSLRYPTTFTGAERKVELTGEAYFEVTHASRQGSGADLPFIVQTGNMDVKVLGTHFNINAYEDEADIKTTLLEGSVDIITRQNTVQTLRLLPGQQSQWSYNSGIMNLVKDADIEQATAWKNGLFKFNSSDLAKIMRQVSRWYDVDIIYEGNVKEETFSGDIPRKEYASEVFRMLEMTKTVTFTIENKTVTIKPFKK